MWSGWLLRNEVVFKGRKVDESQLFNLCLTHLVWWCKGNWPHSGVSIYDLVSCAVSFRFLNCSSVVKSETSWSPPSHGDLQMVPSGVALEKLELENPGDTFLNISKWYNVVSSQLVTSFLGKAVDVGFGDKVALDELFKANAADDNDDMDLFGMKLCRKRDIPEEKFSNAFLWYGPEESHFVVELT
ncbi:hypothetical protein V6N12_047187 [Hibiscus sabdariffa]|uniref:Uncharacterized protein n=1 Tax=Hibiscus sabdariffa TaxID=183260 RepID=A0ABR2DA54_9ROSI